MLAKLIVTGGTAYSLEAFCHQAAVIHNRIQLLGVAAPERVCSALSATLNGNSEDAKAEFRIFEPDSQGYATKMGACPYGYTISRSHLGYDTYHLLAVSRDPVFIPHLTDGALLAKLRSERYTTPFLSEWVPTIRGVLEDSGLLEKCICLNCEAANLSATTDNLDKVVTQLVSTGVLKFPGYTLEAVA